jgi:hypothetical protein
MQSIPNLLSRGGERFIFDDLEEYYTNAHPVSGRRTKAFWVNVSTS